MKRGYTNPEEIQARLPRLCTFYEKYSQVFPNYVSLPESQYMFKNIQKKQRVIDEQNQPKQKQPKQFEELFSTKFIDSVYQNHNDISLDRNNINESLTRYSETATKIRPAGRQRVSLVQTSKVGGLNLQDVLNQFMQKDSECTMPLSTSMGQIGNDILGESIHIPTETSVNFDDVEIRKSINEVQHLQPRPNPHPKVLQTLPKIIAAYPPANRQQPNVRVKSSNSPHPKQQVTAQSSRDSRTPTSLIEKQVTERKNFLEDYEGMTEAKCQVNDHVRIIKSQTDNSNKQAKCIYNKQYACMFEVRSKSRQSSTKKSLSTSRQKLRQSSKTPAPLQTLPSIAQGEPSQNRPVLSRFQSSTRNSPKEMPYICAPIYFAKSSARLDQDEGKRSTPTLELRTLTEGDAKRQAFSNAVKELPKGPVFFSISQNQRLLTDQCAAKVPAGVTPTNLLHSRRTSPEDLRTVYEANVAVSKFVPSTNYQSPMHSDHFVKKWAQSQIAMPAPQVPNYQHIMMPKFSHASGSSLKPSSRHELREEEDVPEDEEAVQEYRDQQIPRVRQQPNHIVLSHNSPRYRPERLYKTRSKKSDEVDTISDESCGDERIAAPQELMRKRASPTVLIPTLAGGFSPSYQQTQHTLVRSRTSLETQKQSSLKTIDAGAKLGAKALEKERQSKSRPRRNSPIATGIRESLKFLAEKSTSKNSPTPRRAPSDSKQKSKNTLQTSVNFRLPKQTLQVQPQKSARASIQDVQKTEKKVYTRQSSGNSRSSSSLRGTSVNSSKKVTGTQVPPKQSVFSGRFLGKQLQSKNAVQSVKRSTAKVSPPSRVYGGQPSGPSLEPLRQSPIQMLLAGIQQHGQQSLTPNHFLKAKKPK